MIFQNLRQPLPGVCAESESEEEVRLRPPPWIRWREQIPGEFIPVNPQLLHIRQFQAVLRISQFGACVEPRGCPYGMWVCRRFFRVVT